MSVTYCGKDCTSCAEKERLACPGCRVGPGAMTSSECEIAKCCRNRGHSGCHTCIQQGDCPKRNTRENAAEYRMHKKKREQEQEARRRREYPILGNWLMVLFWLVIGSTVVGLVMNDKIAELYPQLKLLVAITDAVFAGAYALVLLKLSKVCDCYRIAAISGIVCAAVGLIADLMAGTFWGWVAAFVVVVASFLKEFQEYMGHGDVVEELDGDMAEKWRRLWLWKVWTMIAAVVGAVLAFLVPMISALLVLGAAIAAVIIAVVQVISLRATAMLFREHPAFQSYQ